MRLTHLSAAVACLISILGVPVPAHAATKPHIFQLPALSRDLIAFGYAGDLWTVPCAGGRATRLTTGVGIETAPVFSPDGNTIAFTGRRLESLQHGLESVALRFKQADSRFEDDLSEPSQRMRLCQRLPISTGGLDTGT